jgi:hypothetical protein
MIRYFSILTPDDDKVLQAYDNDAGTSRRVVQLANLARFFIAILIIKLTIYLVSGSAIMDFWAKMFTFPLLASIIGTLMWNAWLLETGRERSGRIALASIISASCVFSVIFCGGFIASDFTAILIFPMVLGFCILPVREARLVFFATLIVPLAVDLLVRAFGVSLPDFSASPDGGLTQSNLLLTLFAAVYFCLSYLKQSPAIVRDSLPDDVGG